MLSVKSNLIKEYAKNAAQIKYINKLSKWPLEGCEGVLDIDDNQTFQDVMEVALEHIILHYDYKTEDHINKKIGSDVYTPLHFTKSEAEWIITMDEKGFVTVIINMSNEHFIIMSLAGTLKEMAKSIIDENVAHRVIITDLNVKLLYSV